MKKIPKRIISFLLALCLAIGCTQINCLEVKAADNISVSGATYPNWIKKGNAFVLKGTVRSSTNITSLTASLCDANGKAVYSKKVTPNSRSYNLRGIDAAMRFDKLSANPYTYRVVATNSSGTYNVIIKPFMVYTGTKPSYVTNLDMSKEYKLCVQEDPSMVMDIAGTAASDNVLVKKDIGQSTANWCLESGGDGSYMIKNVESGLYLDVASGSYTNGTNVQIWTGNNSNAQKWYFIKEGGVYKIIARNNYLTLSLEKSVAENRPNVDMWRDIQAQHQRFYLLALGEELPEEQSKTLSINWDHIKSVGNQAGRNAQGKSSDSCQCFALAYCRTILDGKVYSWKDFNYNGRNGRHDQYNACGWPGKANYKIKYPKTQEEVFRAAYDSINGDKPMIVWVTGSRSTWHYITIVGYQNVTSPDSLSAENFLIIDSCPGATKSAPENMKTVGYSLKKAGNGKYQYLIQ